MKLKKIEIFTDNIKNEELINFTNNNEELFSIIKNNELYKVLEKDLSKNKFFKKKISDNKKLSFVNEYQLIEHAKKYFTKKYFSKKIIKKYNSFAYTAIIKHEKIKNDTAIQIFTKKGPLAFLPISNNETSVVFSVHNSIEKKNIEELKLNYVKFMN